MDLPYLIKFINSKLNNKQCNLKQTRAEMLCLSAIRGENAHHIFGEFFGSSNVFRYTKKITPDIKLQPSPFGCYISSLQFYDQGVPNEEKLSRLNIMLANINYNQYVNIPELDFSEIENFKF